MRIVGIAALTAAFFCSFLPPCVTLLMAADARSMPKKSSRITLFAIMLGVQALLFVVSVSFLAMEAHNPFIYFNF